MRYATQAWRAPVIEIELSGLEVFGRHGVLEAERRDGQIFLFDVRLRTKAPGSDRIADAVDYRSVVARIREVSDAQAYQLLESLAAAVADGLIGSFPLAEATVRVSKQPSDLPVARAAVTVTRP
jgi:dihydroneopterin aldolase